MVKKSSKILYFIVPFLSLLLIKYLFYNSNTKEDEFLKSLDGISPNTQKEVKLPDKIDFISDVKPILSDRCYSCHGPDAETREAGLRFDTKEGAFSALGERLDRYAIVPRDVKSSILVSRISALNKEELMPPLASNLTLTNYEKQVLTKWVEQGAAWKKHWAFILPQKGKIPKISDINWAYNEIDHFIAKRLEQEGLSPSKKANKEKLIRKVYFDIIGLPPKPTDIDAFLNDKNKNAYEKVVDQLLASEAYGERMTSDWLDMSRYADTHGYQDDLERIMWPWRDWVISAFNRNMPFDQFVKWQLAGDLMPNATLEQILATGFNRNHKITQEGGVIDEEYRVEYVLDRTNTTSKAFMGLTMECARCHDHKYDPISQKEFYSFYSFFNKVDEKGRIEYDEIPEPNITITAEVVKEVLSFINLPDSIKEVKLMVMKDNVLERKTHVLKRGAYDAPADEVQAGVPKVILPFSKKFDQNRLGLANWFFDKKNPLTSRVAINRMWQQIFGTGIVATSDDFGSQGTFPSHPELLDWLAVTFIEEGWNIKKMLKRMVLSSTYQQSSKVTPQLLKVDPENFLLARSSRNKLTAEMVRDNALAVSGLLVYKIGGPSVKPYQPKGIWAETTSGVGLTKYVADTGPNRYRRSLYTFWKRTVPPPSMMIFDAATRDFCDVKRQKTSTPLQALVMLNDTQLIEAARYLAFKVLEDSSLSDTDRIKKIFRKITSRFPNKGETKKLLTYVETIEKEANTPNKTVIINHDKYAGIPFQKLHAFTVLTSLVFNLDEAIVKN